VVFEGGEGAGKSTQVTLLADVLRAQDRDVVVTREPGATDVGARIRRLVLNSGDAPSPRAEALLYAADRAHHVATVVRPALARGAIVVSDRYVDSSLAYQGAGRTLPVQEISWLSSWATGGLKPDLVVLLDVDPGVGLGRVDSRGGGIDRLESESRSFHERVRYAFLDLAAADPKRYLVLDAARPPEEIAEAVARRVADLLAVGDAARLSAESNAARLSRESTAGRLSPESAGAPPKPDLAAPDLSAHIPSTPHLAAPHASGGSTPHAPGVAARHASGEAARYEVGEHTADVDRYEVGEHAEDAVTPLEGMAELVGINDDEGPPTVADDGREVGRRRRS
jgi:dTMP kinase